MNPAILAGEVGTRPSGNCGQAKANGRGQGKPIFGGTKFPMQKHKKQVRSASI